MRGPKQVKMERTTQLLPYILIVICLATMQNGCGNTTIPFHVGVVLDMGTLVGKMGWTSISMAIDDFYALHSNYTTRLVLHPRDSKNDVVQAAASALDLLENVQVQTIIGPQQSAQAIFLTDLASKSQVPLLTFSATSPSLSSTSVPYFIRATLNDSTQVTGPLFSLIKAFGWREVVPIYEDSNYGRNIIPYLIDTLQGIGTRLSHRSVISLSSSDDQIKEELYKLMTMETRVFIVHMSEPVGTRLFTNAKEVGMMSQGYVWIMTDGLTNIIDSLDASVINSMQGTLGMKIYVPESKELNNFIPRWRRRFLQEYPYDQPVEPSIFGLWAYDTIWALAMAAEKVGSGAVNRLRMSRTISNSTSLEMLRVSANGPKLLETILTSNFIGLSGEFHLINGQLKSSIFQIINVVGRGGRGIGFWSPQYGFSRELPQSSNHTYSNSITDLNSAIWPGELTAIPKGWENPVNGRKLRIGVPIKDGGFQEFVNVEKDPLTNSTIVSGYCIDVFEAVIKNFPYDISHEYIPYENPQGQSAGTYNDLVYQVHLQKYDAVVGDITIRANRSKYVEFTLPYTESGVSMIVPVKEIINKNAWIFLKPLTIDLWLGTFAFFLFTGSVVWVMEHRINTDFRGPFSQQLGTMFYFSFSMLVFAHREKVENVFSRIVVIIWVFVVLILTSSYTASLSSMLTVQQLQPTVTSVQELQKNGEYVGYHKGSFIEGLLKQLNFDDSKIIGYDYPEDYAVALSKGSKNGGVSAIVHEIPYNKLFLARHCTGYAMVGPIYKTAGFGFVFPKGSPLVPDFSRGILDITEGKTMIEIEKKWFGDKTACLKDGNSFSSKSLTFRSFWGLFLITGAASTSALLLFLTTFFYRNWHDLKTTCPDKSGWQTIRAWFNYYNMKDLKFYAFRRENSIDENGDINSDNRHATKTEASVSIDKLSNTSSFSNISDANFSPQENSSFSIRMASPSTEVQLVPLVVTS